MRWFLVAVQVAAFMLGVANCARFYSASRFTVGMAGGVTLTINGQGFSEDQFSQFDPSLGNKVLLVNSADTIPCDVITHLTTTRKIVCNTRARTNMKAPILYNIKVFVDGEEATGNREVQYLAHYSPRVRSVRPLWSMPGQVVQVSGSYHTDTYQLANTSDPLAFRNTAHVLTKVYMGGRECEMYNRTTEELYGPFSRSSLSCKVLTTYAGPMNLTLYVTRRGTSVTDKQGVYVDAQDRLYQHHTYAAISSISPSTSSSGGGALITITGVGFDAHPGATVVRVGGAICQVREINDTHVTCLAPREDQTGPASGERGLLLEMWDGVYFDDLTSEEAAAQLTSHHTNYSTTVINTTSLPITNSKPSSGRISGLLRVGHSGQYSLYAGVRSGKTWLYLATDGDPSNKTLIREERVQLEGNTSVYLEILFRGPARGNFFMTLTDYDAKYTASQTTMAKNEAQKVVLKLGVRHEVQRFRVVGNVSQLTIYLNGMTSDPVTNISDPGQVRSAILSLLEHQCEVQGDNPDFFSATGFEKEEQRPEGVYSIVRDDLAPYCGRFTSELGRNTYIYYQGNYAKSVDPYKYPYLCFAVRGKVKNTVKVLFYGPATYSRKRSVSAGGRWVQTTQYLHHNFTSTQDRWSYQCLKLIDEYDDPSIYGGGPTKRLRAVYSLTPADDEGGAVFLDQLAFVDQSINVIQKRPSALKSHGILVSDVRVTPARGVNSPTQGDASLTYDITFPTVNCVGDFPLLGVVTDGLTPDWVSELASANNSTFALDGGSVTVSRQEVASHPVEGTWSLDLQGTRIEGIPPMASLQEMRDLLQGSLGVGGLQVTGQATCYGFTWNIQWTEDPGRKVLPKAYDDGLVFDGTSVSLNALRTSEGRVTHNPISADFLTVRRTEPHVTVTVYGDAAACLTDCSFTYSDTTTARLASVSGSPDTSGVHTLTITGTGFSSTDTDDYQVKVGDALCSVIDLESSEVRCRAEELPAGAHQVSVAVQPAGAALHPQVPLTYNVSLSLTSVSPTSGGTGGGYPITVSGSGLPPALAGWRDAVVTLNTHHCTVTAAAAATVTCIVPPGVEGAANVSVVVGGLSATLAGGFTYQADVSPILTSVSPTASSVIGGEELTISGSGFGNGTDSWVKVGSGPCEVVSWTPATITCTSPALSPGHHLVTIYTGQRGYASGTASVTYTLKVTATSRLRGSVHGGTILVLRGAGFGTNCSLLKVDLGESAECQIIECHDTAVNCHVRLLPVTHVVNNSGSQSDGAGVSWSPQVVRVREGDKVTWVWHKVNPHSQVLYNVFQIQTPAHRHYDGSGFHSGSPTPSGSLTVTFLHAGTYYYAGSPLADSLVMSGQVQVTKPEPMAYKVTLRLGGVEAEYDPSGESVDVSVEGCEALVEDVVEGCNVTTPATPDTRHLYFTSDLCLTPTITNITTNTDQTVQGIRGIQVRGGSVLAFSGSGLGVSPCQTLVKVGTASCTTRASSTHSATCSLDDLHHLVSLTPLPLEVNVINRGIASTMVGNPEDEGQVIVVPVMTSIEPTQGSLAGGTLITIRGSGLRAFDNTAAVKLGSESCEVLRVTPTFITCSSSPSPAGQVNLHLTLSAFKVPVVKELPAAVFTFSAAVTPSISNVSVSGETFTITGSLFGSDPSGVNVTLLKISSRRRRSTEHGLGSQVPISGGGATLGNTLTDEFPEEDTKTARSERDAGDVADLLDESEDAGKFWGALTNTAARSYRQSRSLRAWRVAGSLPTAVEDPVVKVSRVRRDTDQIKYPCKPTSVTDTTIVCETTALPAGKYEATVNVKGLGNALGGPGARQVVSGPQVTTVTPTEGSVNGGALLTLIGSGFTPGEVSVTLGGQVCQVESETVNAITCRTPPHPAGVVDLVLTSGGTTLTSPSAYTYLTAKSPVLNTVTPASDVKAGTELTLSGAGLRLLGSDPEVLVGGAACTVTAATDTMVTCSAPDLPGGSHRVVVRDTHYGDSNGVPVTYTFSVTSVSPAKGGFGGAEIVVSGHGFDPAGGSTVTVCGSACTSTSTSTSTSIICATPPKDQGGGASVVECDVVVTNPDGSLVTLTSGFTYDDALTPSVTSTSPGRGGTAGGTRVTITGTNFAASGNAVTIGGSPCVVTSESVTEITCVTEAHQGPGIYPVTVTVPHAGAALTDASHQFFYIDRWSSEFTWGGDPVPAEGDLVVVDEGQTVLLDQSTPVLKMLLIKGGKVVFDREATSELLLRAEYILIVEGGSLEVGSEQEPYTGQAVIELHGNIRSIELPIYGAKVLAVRNGSLELHGAPVPVTWTHLASTAPAGATSITLTHKVTWTPGDQIVIASTGRRFTRNENEVREIASVSADGLQVVLSEPLSHQHLSLQQTLGGRTVETRAEVGLLTRNVKIRGAVNSDFTRPIPPCDDTWSPAQFATQTCFNGKFGEEIGSDQFGATVMLSSKEPSMDLVHGRLEYVEITEAGQAYQLGRHPINFQLAGEVAGSYVRGCSLHRAFNRAITLRATHLLAVRHNVIYDTMGHAVYTEEGTEHDNTFEHNLVVFTKPSSSMLNTDLTPASLMVTNPKNIVRHNAVAGGTHFGFWYRLDASVPSTSVCPNSEQMGGFSNNSAHSLGRYGLWVFSRHGYYPRNRPCSGADVVAVWEYFTAWRCERGAEVVKGGPLQFHNFVALDNRRSGLEMVQVRGGFGMDDGPGIFNSLVVGYSPLLTPEGCRPRVSGITAPSGMVFSIADTTFVNYDQAGCSALAGCSKCGRHQGGYRTQVKGLAFHNAENKLEFKWQHESLWMDVDGTLTGTPESRVLPSMAILPPARCEMDVPAFSSPSVGGAVCSQPIKFLRVSVARGLIEPSSLLSRDLSVSNTHGNVTLPVTGSGWMGLIYSGETYKWSFAYSDQITNITYRATTTFMELDDYYFVQHQFIQTPDSFRTTNVEKDSLEALPDPATNVHGDYYWHDDTRTMTYMVHGRVSRRRRQVFEDRPVGFSRQINFKVSRCEYEGCVAPTVPPIPTVGPNVTYNWSDRETWKNQSDGTYHVPADGDDVVVPQGMWLIVDTQTPSLGTVTVYGTLEFPDTMDHDFVANIIFIQGGAVLAGQSEAEPFTHQLTITLRGSHDPNDPNNQDMPMPNGVPSVGWKAIGVFGQLSLFGQSEGKCWVKLGSTAAAGQSQITLAEPVHAPSWLNKTVMITTSGKESNETEVRQVVQVAGTTLTLDTPLTYDHLGSTYTLSDGTTEYRMASEVGLLTRNIVVQGNEYPGHEEESFGARILVSTLTSPEGVTYKGQVQLSNVELRRAGQEGFTDTDDPRYSLAFHGLGADGEASWVKRCSFNLNYNTAIGVFGTNNLVVEDNVVYHTVGSCIRDEGTNNTFRRNLVSVMLFTGTYRGRREHQNKFWFAGFTLNKASGTVLEGNVVAGSEQAGFQTYGEPCDEETKWHNNEVHGAIYGVLMRQQGGVRPGETCQRLANFYVWRAWDTAFYMQHYASLVLTDVVAVDCEVGVRQVVYGPPATTHTYQDKRATTRDSVFVGASPAHTCAYVSSTAAIASFYGGVLWSHGVDGGNAGVLLSIFLSSATINSDPALRGASFVTNVKFAHYQTRECGKDVALLTNYDSDDATHPVFASGLTFLDTPQDNYLFLHKPKLHRINPADCVDMHCDGLKKVLIQDMDGSLLGSVNATATAISEYQWDGEPAHGVGDYRIPISLRQNIDGSQINAQDKFPNKGIVRDGSCTQQAAWRAWRCTSLIHRMMVIESLDADTRTRRLSPVALIANPGTNGYVDLVNGPMDHSWCMGYTCQERLSTFYTVVAASYVYEVAMTGTPPQRLRFHLLHSDPGEAVVVRMFFPLSQRYDVYVGDTFVPPANIDHDQYPASYQLLPDDPADPEAFFPTLQDAAGTNYLQRRAKLLHLVVRGGQVVNIKLTPLIILTLGIVVDPSNFFEEDVVLNMALLLDVPPENIRITNIIREDARRRRKKRSSTQEVLFEFEVAGAPSITAKNDSTTTIPGSVGELLDYNELETRAKNLVDDFQGSCEKCNLTITSIKVIHPPPPVEDPGPPATKEEGSVVIPGAELYTNVQQEKDLQHLEESLAGEEFEMPRSLSVVQGVPPRVPAFTVFSIQPVVSALTAEATVVNSLGLSTDPWRVTAWLTGGPPGAVLQGTTSVVYKNGSATFTDLSVSRAGGPFGLTFNITYPTTVPPLAVTMATTFQAYLRPAKLKVTGVPKAVKAGEEFNINVMLVYVDDQSTAVDPAHLQGQNATVTILTNPEGVLLGKERFTLPGERASSFSVDGLRIERPGSYGYSLQVSVMPAGWDLEENGRITVTSDSQMEVKIRFLSTTILKMVKSPIRLAEFAETIVTVLNRPVNTVVHWANMKVTLNRSRPYTEVTVSGEATDVTGIVRMACSHRRLKVTIFRLSVGTSQLTCSRFLTQYPDTSLAR